MRPSPAAELLRPIEQVERALFELGVADHNPVLS